MWCLERVLQAGDSSRKPSPGTAATAFPKPDIYIMPTLHQHLPHTSHMQIVPLAAGPVAPAPPFLPTPMARRTHLPIQVELHFPIVQHHRQLGAAWVEVEPAGPAVVDEARHVLPARVAAAGPILCRRCQHELEGALGVEGVRHGCRRDGTVRVEVEVARGATVVRADADLLAPVTLERELGVLERQGVLGMAEVGDFMVLHGRNLVSSNAGRTLEMGTYSGCFETRTVGLLVMERPRLIRDVKGG